MSKDGIIALLKRYEGALNSSNLDVVMDIFDAEGVLLQPDCPPSVGIHNLKKSYEALFALVDHDVTFDIQEIEVVPNTDWAFGRTICTGKCTFRDTGVVQPDAVQTLFVFKRVEGTWKIARYSFSPTKV